MSSLAPFAEAPGIPQDTLNHVIIWSTKDALTASGWPLSPCFQRQLWIILFTGYSPISGAPDRGEDHHKIQRWIACGWLRDRRQGTRRHDGQGGDVHRFRENDIVEFIKTHPQEINLAKVEPTWFLDLVLLRGRELHSTSPSRPNFDGDAAA